MIPGSWTFIPCDRSLSWLPVVMGVGRCLSQKNYIRSLNSKIVRGPQVHDRDDATRPFRPHYARPLELARGLFRGCQLCWESSPPKEVIA